MSPIAISSAVFVLIVSGAAAGTLLRRTLPKHHLNEHAKDVVRLGTGLVATISALVLGLLINSASTSYESQRNDVRQMAANLILLDQLLERYGPETRPVRTMLRSAVDPLVVQLWGEDGKRPAGPNVLAPNSYAAQAFIALHELVPKNDTQRSIQTQTIQTATEVQRSRLMLFERAHAGIPTLFLAVLVFWLTMIFVSFSLFSPLNPTSITALLLIALSASAALFLILEMNQPFTGLMQISSNSLRKALAPLAP